MAKQIIVKLCAMCPYRSYSEPNPVEPRDHGFCLAKRVAFTEDDMRRNFPKFCPLKDWVEGED